MGKSWRKPYGWAISCKEWKREYNRRLRRKTKVRIQSCNDYDNLVLPHIREVGNVYNSPRDGKKYLQETPYINDCEVDIYKGRHAGYKRACEMELTDHFPWCECYYNKRSWYWKSCRK